MKTLTTKQKKKRKSDRLRLRCIACNGRLNWETSKIFKNAGGETIELVFCKKKEHPCFNNPPSGYPK